MDIMEEDFERPSTGSAPLGLSEVLEKVKIDSTPTAEKELDFSAGITQDVDEEDITPSKKNSNGIGTSNGKAPLHIDIGAGEPIAFERFLGDGEDEVTSPSDLVRSPDDENGGLELGLGIRDEPRTPTQSRFPR